MATETLQVDSEFGTTDWTLGAGADKISAVALPDDGDTSYIASGTTSGTAQRFGFANPVSIGPSDTINSATLVVRAKRGGAANASFTVSCIAGSDSDSYLTGVVSTSSYQNFTSAAKTLAPGGSAWTLTDLNNLGPRLNNNQSRDVRVTSISLVVDYTPVTDDLTADSLATDATVLGEPTIGQAHAVAATPIATGAATFGTVLLGQVHVVGAVGLTTEAAVLGAPILGQVHGLVADDVTTGAAVLGSPLLSQIHALTADALATDNAVLGAPTFGQVHSIAATGFATGAAILGAPEIGQASALTAEGIVTGAATFTVSSMGQVHVFSAPDLTTLPALFGAPTLLEPIDGPDIVGPSHATVGGGSASAVLSSGIHRAAGVVGDTTAVVSANRTRAVIADNGTRYD